MTENPIPESGRNSRAREYVYKPANMIAERLYNNLHLTANMATIIGGLGVSATALYASQLIPDNPDLSHRVALAAAYGFFLSFDLWDGRIAEVMKRQKVVRNEETGVLLDSGGDRWQELFTFISHMIIASAMGNKWGVETAALAASLRPLTALTRARAEEKGIFVDELPIDPIGFWGNRTGSAIAGFAGLIAPEIRGFNLQMWGDLAVATGTGVTAIRRYFNGNDVEKMITDEQLAQMDEKTRNRVLFEFKIAPKKKRLMQIALASSIAATSLAYLALK